MAIGHAFTIFDLASGQNTDPNEEAVPVGKKFEVIDGRRYLIEGVEYRSIEPFLRTLSKRASLPSRDSAASAMASVASQGRKAPVRTIGSGNPELASATRPRATKGFVIDYVIKNGSAGSGFTFLANGTYYISSTFGVGSSATFQPGCIIKYTNNASLYLYGYVYFPATSPQAVFTSKDDNLYGEIIGGSTGSPTYAASPAIWIYYPTFNTDIRNAYIRWAKVGVRHDHNTGVTATHQFRDSTIKNSQTGVYGGANCPQVTISNSKKCNVTTSKNGACISGDLTVNCDGDNDFDELPDSWEITHWGGTGVQNGNGDPDGDGLINFKEYFGGLNPKVNDTDGDGLKDLQEYEVTFNVVVNSTTADYGQEQNTQFESHCAVLNGNVIVGFVDSNKGVFELGASPYLTTRTPRFVGYAFSQFGGAVFEDKDVPPLSTQGGRTCT